MERKLYVEYRLYFNPQANQEILKEMATQFQEHIHDEWNNQINPNEPDFNDVVQCHDVTYEIVMEITEKVKQ